MDKLPNSANSNYNKQQTDSGSKKQDQAADVKKVVNDTTQKVADTLKKK